MTKKNSTRTVNCDTECNNNITNLANQYDMMRSKNWLIKAFAAKLYDNKRFKTEILLNEHNAIHWTTNLTICQSFQQWFPWIYNFLDFCVWFKLCSILHISIVISIFPYILSNFSLRQYTVEPNPLHLCSNCYLYIYMSNSKCLYKWMASPPPVYKDIRVKYTFTKYIFFSASLTLILLLFLFIYDTKRKSLRDICR